MNANRFAFFAALGIKTTTPTGLELPINHTKEISDGTMDYRFRTQVSLLKAITQFTIYM